MRRLLKLMPAFVDRLPEDRELECEMRVWATRCEIAFELLDRLLRERRRWGSEVQADVQERINTAIANNAVPTVMRAMGSYDRFYSAANLDLKATLEPSELAQLTDSKAQPSALSRRSSTATCSGAATCCCIRWRRAEPAAI